MKQINQKGNLSVIFIVGMVVLLAISLFALSRVSGDLRSKANTAQPPQQINQTVSTPFPDAARPGQ